MSDKDDRIEFPDLAIVDSGPGHTRYTPFVTLGMAGLKCEREGATPQYLYFNPSDTLGDDRPNVFVYQGDRGDPAWDGSLHWYGTWDDSDAPIEKGERR